MQQNRRRKVFNRGLLRLCKRAWHWKVDKNSIDLKCFIFQFFLLWLRGKSLRGDVTGMQETFWQNLIPNRARPEKPGPTYNSENFPKQFWTKSFPTQKGFSRTEQRYVGRTAVKVNRTDTDLDLFTASWITACFVCNSGKSTGALTSSSNNQVPSMKRRRWWSANNALYSMRFEQVRNQGGEAPLENVSPPWKNALDIVLKYWT